MIDWYVEILDSAPDGFKGDKYVGNVIDTASPCMDYFCKRLTEMKDWKLEDANNIFKEIIEELPIMTARVYNNDFIINYNKWVTIKLTETATQIYRESKIRQILE
jgi:CRISPR/Cas system-associated protein Csx1